MSTKFAIRKLYVGFGDDDDTRTDDYYAGDVPAGGSSVRATWDDLEKAVRYASREKASEVLRRICGTYTRAAGYDGEIVELERWPNATAMLVGLRPLTPGLSSSLLEHE